MLGRKGGEERIERESGEESGERETCFFVVEVLVESQFNVELVVQCVRLSPNPQTHHHALLLLSNAAVIFPVRCQISLSLSL